MGKHSPLCSAVLFCRDLLLHAVVPATCAHCKKDLRFRAEEPLCGTCAAGLKPLPEPFCKVCGVFLPDGGAHCWHCKSPSRRRLAKCSLIRSAYLFTPQLRSLIHALKYRARPSLSEYLAGGAGPRLAACAELAPYRTLVPVPLAAARQRERGFNQSLLLARALAKATGASVLEGALFKVKNTPSQAGLDAEKRRDNLVGAFSAGGGLVSGREILLVDDVATTGATMEACAAALKSAGARSVAGFTIGRE